jgi:hypothetical protein
MFGAPIRVTSKEGVGSTFSVHLRYGRSHLSDSHVDDSLSTQKKDGGISAFAKLALEDYEISPTGESEDSPESVGFSYDNTERSANQTNAFDQSMFAVDGSTVLVADDNTDMRNYITSLLIPKYKVETVKDGKQAYQYCMKSNTPPDLIVADFMMPNMDGGQLVETLRGNIAFSSIPVILVSASR